MLGLRPCETGDITKWVCNAPGDVEGCSIRGVPLPDIVKDTAECKRLHRELRSFVGVHHIEVEDGQATMPMVDLAMAWYIFEAFGEPTIAEFLKNVLTLYNGSKGRDLDGNRIGVVEVLRVDAVVCKKLETWQAHAETHGHDVGTSTPRGGQTAGTMGAVRAATSETGTQKKIAVPESAQALGPMDRPRRRGVAAGTRPTGGAPARDGAAATSTAPTVPRRRVTRGEGRRLAAEDRSNPRPRWKV